MTDSEQPAISRLVTSSPTSGRYQLQAGVCEQVADVAVQHVELLILGGSEPVQNHRSATAGRLRTLGKDRLHEFVGQLLGRHPGSRADTRLPVNTEPEVHLTLTHGKQRLVGTRKRAAVKSHAKRVRRGVGSAHRRARPHQGWRRSPPPHAATLYTVNVPAIPRRFSCSSRLAEADIVGHVDDPGIDAFVDQAFCGDTEVQPVTGIVAEREDHSGASVRGPGYPVDLLRRGRSEDVAEHRAVGEPGPHHTVVGRKVARATADDQTDLALQRSARRERSQRHLRRAARIADTPRRSP